MLRMTPTTQQAQTFHDQLIEASNLAVNCWDQHTPIQEVILMAPGMVKAVASAYRFSKAPDAVESCNHLLSGMAAVLNRVPVLLEHDFPMTGVAEFRQAMADLRRLIVDLIDAAEGTPDAPIPAGCESPETIRKTAEMFPPKERWYSEDFSGARGPLAD